MKLTERTESLLIVFLLVCVLGLSNYISYTQGVDAGWWEHEAEENVYACQVLS